MEESAKCAFCGDQANQRCTGCLITFYCSKDHQKQHWKKHKHDCCAYKVCQCGSLGRYIIATRDLKPGELILKEKPLLVAPGVFTESICLGCYKAIKSNPVKCEKCQWPLCSSKCQKAKHHQGECYFMQRKKNSQQFASFCQKQSSLILQIISLLRCLHLKIEHPEKYGKILSLESHTQSRKKSLRFQTEMLLIRTMKTLFCLEDEVKFSDNEILDISGVFNVNSHEIPVTSLPVQAVYDNASMIEHSCVNNASKHFDSDCNIQIRAAVPIKKGERISIMYSDPMWGTASRQSHLMESKFFQCTCKRCRDPTELATNFSSIRCPNCANNGYLSPRNPLNISSDWVCDGCKAREPANYVNAVIKSIGEEIVQLERGSTEACLNFLKKHSQNLHPNHFFLMDVKLALSQMVGKNMEDVHNNSKQSASEKELVTKQKLCLELMEVVDVISPGISRLRGVVMYELQSVLAGYARNKFATGEISEQHLRNILQEVQKYLNECIQIFSFEPSCLSEGQLAAIARLDLVEIETYVDSLAALKTNNKQESETSSENQSSSDDSKEEENEEDGDDEDEEEDDDDDEEEEEEEDD